ncbi:hypothetical protein ACRS6B_09230 [Nocardia asteroides]
MRAAFESAWVRWNILRGVLHTLAFLALCGALFAAGVQQGRATAAPVGHGHVVAGQYAAQDRSGAPALGQS